MHHEKSRLFLWCDIAGEPAVEIGGICNGPGGFTFCRRKVAARIGADLQRCRCGGAQSRQFLFVQITKGVETDALDQKAQTRQVLVLAVAVFIEDAFDRFSHEEGIGCRNEFMEQAGNAALATHATRDINRKTVGAILSPGDKTDIVHRGARTVPITRGESDFIFARKLERKRVGHESLGQGDRVRRNVEHFVRTDAGIKTGCDIAHRVAAAALGGQSGGGKRTQGGQNGFQRHAMHLEFLAGGDVKHAIAED